MHWLEIIVALIVLVLGLGLACYFAGNLEAKDRMAEEEGGKKRRESYLSMREKEYVRSILAWGDARMEKLLKAKNSKRPLMYLCLYKHIIPVFNPSDFSEFFLLRTVSEEQRIIRKTSITGLLSEPVMVSTVFLGIDHSFEKTGAPVLFETMVFGGPHDQYQERYETYQEAVEGHQRVLAMACRAYYTTPWYHLRRLVGNWINP